MHPANKVIRISPTIPRSKRPQRNRPAQPMRGVTTLTSLGIQTTFAVITPNPLRANRLLETVIKKYLLT